MNKPEDHLAERDEYNPGFSAQRTTTKKWFNAMAAALKLVPKLTPDEYLAFERQAEFKSEYCDGELIRMMAWASRVHNGIKENLIGEFYARLKGTPCQSYSSDARVKVERTQSYFYPDIVVVCGAPEFQDDKGDVLLNPMAIVEVLSPSTRRLDAGKKFLHYQRIPTLREYCLVEQDQPFITLYTKQPDLSWTVTLIDGLDQSLTLQGGSMTIPMADIYARIEFEPGQA